MIQGKKGYIRRQYSLYVEGREFAVGVFTNRSSARKRMEVLFREHGVATKLEGRAITEEEDARLDYEASAARFFGRPE